MLSPSTEADAQGRSIALDPTQRRCLASQLCGETDVV